MTVEAVLRVIALIAAVALYISDHGMNLWAKPVGSEVYLMLIAVALGVDVNWARSVFKAVITGMLKVGPVDEGKGE